MSDNLILDFLLNILVELIGILITVLILQKIFEKREEKRLYPLKKTLYHRIYVRCALITSDVRFIAYKRDKEGRKVLVDSIANGKQELLETLQLGESLLQPELRTALLKLDGSLGNLLLHESLLDSSPIGAWFDEIKDLPLEDWVIKVKNILLNLKKIFEILEDTFYSEIIDICLKKM